MEHKEVERGLVKSIKYPYLPSSNSWAIDDPNMAFCNNTVRVFRIPALSKPTDMGYGPGEHKLSMYGFSFADEFISRHPEVIGTDFTLIDGTTWYDGENTKTAMSIHAVNVMWENGIALVTVILGYQRMVKTSKLFHMRTGHPWPIYFRYRPGEGVATVGARVADYIGRRTFDPINYQDSRLVMLALSGCRNPMVEYPVAAATKLGDTVWYVDRPYRHHHVIHSPEYLEAKAAVVKESGMSWGRHETQGFLTNHGNFVERKRAMRMALDQCAIIDSDNLYIKSGFTKEPLYTGILQLEDMTPEGVRIGMTDLFSEDLWP